MNTTVFGEEQGRCWDQSEYEQLIRENSELFAGWESVIIPRLKEANLTALDIAAGCGVSKNCAVSFRHQIPARRCNVIMLAMMLGMSVEETNKLLTRWAKYQRLYARHPEDAIWIYLLNNGGSREPKKLFDAYWKIYESLHAAYLENGAADIPTVEPEGSSLTRIMQQELMEGIRTNCDDPELDEVFKAMIWRHLPAYEDGYRKLIDYIEGLFVRMNHNQDGRFLPEERNAMGSNQRATPKQVFANSKHYLTVYYNRLRALKRKHIVPDRTFLISLGVRLALNANEIDKMLDLAGMAPLCAKDRLESSIVFYLEELYLHIPSFFFQNDPFQRNVLRDETDCEGLLLTDAETNAPRERLMDYIKRRLLETDIFDQDDRAALDAFLGLLDTEEDGGDT